MKGPGRRPAQIEIAADRACQHCDVTRGGDPRWTSSPPVAGTIRTSCCASTLSASRGQIQRQRMW